MRGLTSKEEKAVRDLARRLRDRFGESLVDVRLYGSKARESAGGDSDVDVAVVVTRCSSEVRDAVYGEVSAVVLEHDVLLDVHLLEASHLERLRQMGVLYAEQLDAEGVSV
jgi:predicted nucleotidyltransferase